MRKNRIEILTSRLIFIMYTMMMIWLLALLLFFEKSNYYGKADYVISNLLIVVVAVVVGILYMELKKRYIIKSCSKSLNYDQIVKVTAICLLLVQIYIAWNILFFAGWDAAGVVNAARELVLGEPSQMSSWYNFSVYPNNLFIVYVQALLLEINKWIGIFNGDALLMPIVILNCLINTVSCFLVYKCGRLFVSKKHAFYGFVATVLIVGLSPWIVVCYSDSLGLLFPILCFYLFIKPYEKKWEKNVAMAGTAILAGIGFQIKPQCVIMFIAIVFVEIIWGIEKRNRKRTALTVTGLLIIVIVFSSGLQKSIKYAYKAAGNELDDEAAFGLPHFLMMGMNEKSNGVYAPEDIEFSYNITSKSERNKKDIERAVKRIQDMGPLRLAKHFSKKMLVLYNDGTFAWGKEGNFYAVTYDEVNSGVCRLLRSYYYGDEAANHGTFQTIQKVIWILILLSAAFGVRKNSRYMKEETILMLAVIGLTLFELLFEARARYIYIYVPIYCILASIGFENIKNVIRERGRK